MKVRTFARRKAAERREAVATTNQVQAAPPTDSVKLNWVRSCVSVAVENAEARLRAEAEQRDRLRDTGPPSARERSILKAVSDALLAERRLTQNQQGVGGSGELAVTVNKLQQLMGLVSDTLEEKVNSLEAQVTELRQTLLTLNSRPSSQQPRKLVITHVDGTQSTIAETLADGAKDDDMLPPPPQP
jgi:hypothetical protein